MPTFVNGAAVQPPRGYGSAWGRGGVVNRLIERAWGSWFGVGQSGPSGECGRRRAGTHHLTVRDFAGDDTVES